MAVDGFVGKVDPVKGLEFVGWHFWSGDDGCKLLGRRTRSVEFYGSERNSYVLRSGGAETIRKRARWDEQLL